MNFKPGNLTWVFRAVLHEIDTWDVKTGVTEKARQFCNIPVLTAIVHGEQMA